MDRLVEIKDNLVIGKAGSRDLIADLFIPPGNLKNRPAIVIVHGGGWREGDEKQLRGYGILLAREGFVCICTSYRLSTEAIWPSQIQDVKCAIRYLKANSDDLGLDPARVGITGNSAGGHLSLMAGLSQVDSTFEGEGGNSHVDSNVKAVCAIYPPARIIKYDDSDPIIDAFRMLMGDVSEDQYKKASPILHIDKNFPPTMLIHGSSDSVVKLKDSTDLYQKLVEENIAAELHIFSEEEHAFDSQRGYGRSIAELQNLFFKKYL
tara:strand:- start:69106 stop:69897 length:792 start_codon:yes stop_codon:yes gene_type:complete